MQAVSRKFWQWIMMLTCNPLLLAAMSFTSKCCQANCTIPKCMNCINAHRLHIELYLWFSNARAFENFYWQTSFLSFFLITETRRGSSKLQAYLKKCFSVLRCTCFHWLLSSASSREYPRDVSLIHELDLEMINREAGDHSGSSGVKNFSS